MVLDTIKLNRVKETIDAINSPIRFKILNKLRTNPDLYITELSRKANTLQSTTGTVLKILEKGGLITKENWRDKRYMFYKVNEFKVDKLLEVVNNEENIFLKSYLLSNNSISKILSLLSNGDKLSLVEIDRLAKLSPTNNTGRAFKLLGQLIIANLIKKEGLFYSINGSELVKTIKIFKQL